LTPSKFGVLGATPEWKLLINFCPKSAFHSRFTCRGQIWRKSAVAKLPKRLISYCLQKTRGVGDTLEPPISPPLNRSRPKFRQRCRPLTCACVVYTDFGSDRLRFAGLIPERVQKSVYTGWTKKVGSVITSFVCHVRELCLKGAS